MGRFKPGKVSILRLKEFALNSLPPGCALREVLLADEDVLDMDEFLAQLRLWLTLLKRVRI